MPLVNMTDLLQHAYRHSYAVGAFGVASWDILQGVVETAEAMRAPVILSLSKTYPGTGNIESLALAVAGVAQRAAIPVAFQVEVEDDIKAVEAALHMGCCAVVFDASLHIFTDNVALTKKAVTLAKPYGVTVVGQLGNLENGESNGEPAESTGAKSTSPIEAKHYVERTGVPCLAVSVSRLERGNAKHDFARLAKINQALGIPLAIHGGGGLSDDQFRRMISFGAVKINYSAPLFEVIAQCILSKKLARHTGYAEIVNQVRDAIRGEVERCIRLWGCGGRAAEILQQSRAWVPGGADEAKTSAETSDTLFDASTTSPVFARRGA